MSDENSVRIEAGEATPRVADVETSPLTRRTVLRTAASALAGGSVLATAADEAAAAPHGGGTLDVRTTDVEVLDDGGGSDGETTEVRTTGRVAGMSNFDCERCEVGAQVRPVGGDRWYGGLRTVEHTHRDSFRVSVTLAGLHPGKYECRLCACPITHSNVFVANVLIVVVTAGKRRGKKKKKKHGKKEKKHHEKKGKKHRKKLQRAYRKTCPCGLHHPDRYHLMICGGDHHASRKYAFQVSSYDVQQVAVSNAPDVVSSQRVTIDAEAAIDGTVVTGTVAGGGHSYVCGGALTDARVESGASVFVNGSDVTAAVGSY